MNLFLHGIKDFQIVNDDTLARPAFIENGQIMRFDIVVANPPYSINQWNREAFANDKYGRNFLGTPSQGRADYAFFQHILRSLDPQTGRCAILFPHGVLFRVEESSLRKKLIKNDLVDCVIGLGPNLFFNSPMEACIVVCRANKEPEKRGRILIINAVNEVIRKNAQSYLEDAHIQRIAKAYAEYKDIEGLARVVTQADAEKNGYSLNISLYVRNQSSADEHSAMSLPEYVSAWRKSASSMMLSMNSLTTMLDSITGDNDA